MSTTHSPICPSGTEAAVAPCDAPCPPRERPLVLAATILASSMAFIDATVVHVALPAIQSSLGASFTHLQWVVNGYTLMLGALLLAGGALGDQIGRRAVFLAGIAVFALASVACALSGNAPVLIASRIVQGVGAALMVPQSLAIIAASYPRAERGRAIGTWAAFSALTTAAGPAVGGLLIDSTSWRAVFWLNMPLALLAVLLTIRHVPESRSAQREAVDWAGAALATAGFGGLTYALSGWPGLEEGLPAERAIALVTGIGALTAFIWVERRTATPLAPPTLFRSRAFSGLNAMTLLLYAALSGALFLLPYNLIQVQGYSATQAGLALVPLGLLIGVLSRYSGRLADRVGPWRLLVLGPMLVAAGCAALALPDIGGGYWTTFFVPIAVIALGMALAVSPLTTAVMNAAPDERSGAASGINNTASRVAGLLAVALSGAIATTVFSAALDDRLQSLALPDELQALLLEDAARLAELSLPASADAGLRAGVEQAVEASFVTAFRAGALLNAALAAMAAVIAALVLRPGHAAR